jgi:hypothetical protein
MEAEEYCSAPKRCIPYRALMFNYGWVDKYILDYPYPGAGSSENPFTIGWTPNDPRDPMQFSQTKRWIWTGLVSMANFTVALATSAYTASPAKVMQTFSISQEVFELGLSAFILG